MCQASLTQLTPVGQDAGQNLSSHLSCYFITNPPPPQLHSGMCTSDFAALC